MKVDLPFAQGEEVVALELLQKKWIECEICKGKGSFERFDCHGSYDVGCSKCHGDRGSYRAVHPHWIVTVPKKIKRIILYEKSTFVDVLGCGFLAQDMIPVADVFSTKEFAEKEANRRNAALEAASKIIGNSGR